MGPIRLKKTIQFLSHCNQMFYLFAFITFQQLKTKNDDYDVRLNDDNKKAHRSR